MAIMIEDLAQDETLDSQARRTILGGSRSLGAARSSTFRSTPSAVWAHTPGSAEAVPDLPGGTGRLPLLALARAITR